MKKRSFWLVILIIVILIIGVGVGIVFWYFSSGHIGPELNSNSNGNSGSAVASSENQSQTDVVRVDNPIDFKELQDTNVDIYAWLKVPNTAIDYPVLQSYDTDDGFYLDHNIYRNYEFAGSLYTEMKNKKDFSDPNTVIYGHDMLNGTMFQNLHYFENSDFFDENQYMYVYTTGHILTYEIFAAYIYDNRHILNSFDFSDKDVVKEYFDSCLNPRSMYANVRDGVTLGTDDKILTLSTCVGYDSGSRYLVQGVLVKDELTW